eukprot:jgi/Tetstr1/457953/TSEL_044466.t1
MAQRLAGDVLQECDGDYRQLQQSSDSWRQDLHVSRGQSRQRLDMGHGFLKSIIRNQKDRDAYEQAWREALEEKSTDQERKWERAAPARGGEDWSNPKPWRSFLDADGNIPAHAPREAPRQKSGRGNFMFAGADTKRPAFKYEKPGPAKSKGGNEAPQTDTGPPKVAPEDPSREERPRREVRVRQGFGAYRPPALDAECEEGGGEAAPAENEGAADAAKGSAMDTAAERLVGDDRKAQEEGRGRKAAGRRRGKEGGGEAGKEVAVEAAAAEGPPRPEPSSGPGTPVGKQSAPARKTAKKAVREGFAAYQPPVAASSLGAPAARGAAPDASAIQTGGKQPGSGQAARMLPEVGSALQPAAATPGDILPARQRRKKQGNSGSAGDAPAAAPSAPAPAAATPAPAALPPGLVQPAEVQAEAAELPGTQDLQSGEPLAAPEGKARRQRRRRGKEGRKGNAQAGTEGDRDTQGSDADAASTAGPQAAVAAADPNAAAEPRSPPPLQQTGWRPAGVAALDAGARSEATESTPPAEAGGAAMETAEGGHHRRTASCTSTGSRTSPPEGSHGRVNAFLDARRVSRALALDEARVVALAARQIELLESIDQLEGTLLGGDSPIPAAGR